MSHATSEEIGSSRTPGPWTIDKNTGLDVMGPDGKDVCVALCQEMGGMLFDKQTIGPERRQQAFDNALLIAAAPDLLALAKQFAKECAMCGGTARDPWNDPNGKPCTDCADIRAVIAKAEGRS